MGPGTRNENTMDGNEFLLTALMFGGGAGAIGLGTWRGLRARFAQKWPQVPGEIIFAKVTESTTHRGYVYEPSVRYRYEVNGEIYHSDRIRFGSLDINDSHSAAERALQAYPKGSRVQVRYDPAKPSEAVLEVEIGSDTPGLVIGGSLALLLGLFVLWAWRT